jgi:hypothetical protein
MVRVLIFSLFLVSLLSSEAQEEVAPEFAETTLFGSAGALPVPLYAQFHGSVELRVVPKKGNSRFAAQYIRLGGGKWGAWEATGAYGLAGVTLLTGTKASHFETLLGLSVHNDEISESVFALPAVSLGYRYQAPAGFGIFRTGVGWPEGIYLSLGFAM